MDELIIIGKNITRIRKLNKLTQEDLCGLTDMDRGHLSEIENGKVNITVRTLFVIAKALKCSVVDLIS